MGACPGWLGWLGRLSEAFILHDRDGGDGRNGRDGRAGRARHSLDGRDGRDGRDGLVNRNDRFFLAILHGYQQFRYERVRHAADWVSQLSSTEDATLDVQILYACGSCNTVPLKAFSWFLLKSPNLREFWACPSCGDKFSHSTCPQVILCKLPCEGALCSTVRNMPSGWRK